ncbi:integrin alpha-8-like [Penaeus monodon]|uniref:integrin alpha-8-like n=1 Tax=Penaeus monodon TaxID=6687 RepID=UPI0018A7A245|nr:integrin alpha-8-like [Penaeus monodon]
MASAPGLPLPLRKKTQRELPAVLSVLVLVLAAARQTGAFNLDTSLARVLAGPNKTYFGYSVALWADVRNPARLVVGAPKGTDSADANGTIPLGNVHLCDPFGSVCPAFLQLPKLSGKDESKPAIADEGLRAQGIGFGETVYATDSASSKLAVCAPRYPRQATSYTALQPRGACFVLQDDRGAFVKVLPYAEECYILNGLCFKNTNVYTGYALHGFSVTMSEDHRNIYMGGPYAFYAQGQVARGKTGDGLVNTFNKQTYGPSSLDYSLEGWATAIGQFDGRQHSVAASTPAWSNSKGMVSKRPRSVLVGKEPWGRFGHTVSCPGDLNQDGYDDVAVGAPFSDEGGVVYIYNGGGNGLRTEHTQKITASQFSAGIRSFGFSIDGGIDVDNNSHPDLIIGAPESDTAVFIRTAPVVNLEGTIEVEPRVISMGNKLCNVGGQDVACFNITVNMQHRTKNVSQSLPMVFSFDLDSKYRRFAFMDGGDYRLVVTHDVRSVADNMLTLSKVAYVKEGRPRLDVPLLVRANVSLAPVSGPQRLPPERRDVPSILDLLSPPVFEARARLECEDITACYSKPDLVLESRHKELMVQEGSVEIEVVLQVLQATAYSVTLEATYPSVLTFSHVSGSRFLPKCRESLYVSERTRAKQICTYNELAKNLMVSMLFHFEYNPLTLLVYEERHLNLSFVAASEIPDRNERDNAFAINVPVVSRVDLYTEGVSSPDNVEARINETLSLREIVNVSQAAINRTQLGPETTHRFSVTNRGPSPLLAAEMEIRVPFAAPNGLPLLYLVENPVMSPSLTCSSVPVNPRNFNTHTHTHTHTQHKHTHTRHRDRETGRDKPPNIPLTYSSNSFCASDVKHPLYRHRCHVTSLLPDETVYLQFTTYITTATIKLIGYTSVALESSLVITTSQANVTVSRGNGRPDASTANTHVTLIAQRLGFFKRKRLNDDQRELMKQSQKRRTQYME